MSSYEILITILKYVVLSKISNFIQIIKSIINKIIEDWIKYLDSFKESKFT